MFVVKRCLLLAIGGVLCIGMSTIGLSTIANAAGSKHQNENNHSYGNEIIAEFSQ